MARDEQVFCPPPFIPLAPPLTLLVIMATKNVGRGVDDQLSARLSTFNFLHIFRAKMYPENL